MAVYKSILLLSMMMILATNSAPTQLTPVNLRSAGNFAILSQSGVTTTGATAITGQVGVSPAAATSITGFGLIMSADGTSSSSGTVTGSVYAADYVTPTPSNLQNATADSQNAYEDAASRTNPDYLNLGGGSLNALTLTGGLYQFTIPLTFGDTITLSGSSTDVFIFQTTGTLGFGSTANIVLSGVLASNVFYQSAGQVTLGAGAAVQGIILGKTAIVFDAGATLTTGRALAGTAVTLIGNTITSP